MIFSSLFAQAQLDSASKEELPSDTLKIIEWRNLAIKNHSDYQKAIGYSEKALRIANNLGNEKWIHRCNLTTAFIEMRASNFKEAREKLIKARDFFVKHGSQSDLAEAYRLLGLVSQYLENYVDAIDYFQNALKINIAIGDKDEEGSVCVSIGAFYGSQQDYDLARDYFLQASEAFNEVGNKLREHVVYLNLGAVNKDSKNFEQSIRYSLKAKSYFQKHQDEHRLGIISYNLGVCFRELGNYPQSEEELSKALQVFKIKEDKLRFNGTNLELGKVWAAQRNFQKALEFAFIALEGFKDIKMPSQVLRTLEFIAEVYELQENFEEANKHLKGFMSLKDSLNLHNTQTSVAEIEEKYQAELKEQQLLDAQNKLELQQLLSKRQETKQNILIVFLLFAGLVLGLVYNQFRQRQKINLVLLEKNELIQRNLSNTEILLKEIHHRVKNNLQYVSSLLNLQARHLKEPSAKSVLIESKNRIHSMALVHQKLYQEDNFTGVLMDEYLYNLVSSLKGSYRINDQEINLILNVDGIRLEIDSAMPIGLLINEAITNSFKHAISKERVLFLHITLKNDGEKLNLQISDNGPGMNTKNPMGEQSLGFKLMQSLAEKLGGTLIFKSDNGVHLSLEITKFKVV